jgi:uncharacterized repeat protein (TIGR01451 family)
VSRLSTVRFPVALALAIVAVASPRSAVAGTPGIDGAKTVTAANTVVNGYDYVIAATAGARTITVHNAANLSPAGLTPLGPGSVVLLYQANGATIDGTDSATYGSVTSYGNAGYYEFATVGSVSGNVITIASSCNALAHSYATSGTTGASEAEIVRVPQYSSLTINSGASITATAWSASENTTSGSASYGSPLSTGGDGGIVAIDVAGTTTINGSITVTGDGFIGGDGYQNAGDSAPGVHTQPITDTVFTGETGGDLSTALGAMKGESIAGNQATLDASYSGRYGRGAPANGGGGGNGHNTGGGGGSNGNNGNTWYGVGLQDTTYTAYYSNANGQNPLGTYDGGGYSANGTALAGTPMSIDSGGGRGGYSFGCCSGAVVPTNVGGLGGRPLTATANARIFFGGGGGAGDENDGSGGHGGTGGGIVLLNTGTLAGSGSIVANGTTGGSPSASDAAGGGGGGGSVVVLAGSGSVATINANGGAGGNAGAGSGGSDTEGTGGGGGGGFVAAPAATITVAGGTEGQALSPAPQSAAFVPYGATLGATGLSTTAPSSFTYCYTPVIGQAKAAGTPSNNGNGSFTVTYTIVFENYGDTPLSSVVGSDPLASTFTTGTFSVTTAPAVTATTGSASLTVNSSFNGTTQQNFVTAGSLPIGATATVTFSVTFTPPVGSQTYTNSATATANGTTGNANGVAASDTSDNGSNPDPAGYGNPNQSSENVGTPVTVMGQPVLTKTVRNVTTGEATGLTADTASPGNQLEYTIAFPNGTSAALSNIVVRDTVPANTTYKSSACGALASGVTACSASYSAGVVTYTLTGSLAAGATQTFLLDVTVN